MAIHQDSDTDKYNNLWTQITSYQLSVILISNNKDNETVIRFIEKSQDRHA